MKTTVIVATYNGAKYIYRQIDSIVEQTITPNQIVVTDDGSTDDTLNIVRDFEKKYVNIEWIIIKNNHKGFIGNYLNGLDMAKNEIIFLSDQDDEWKEDKIERHLIVYKKEKPFLVHGEIDIVDLNGDAVFANSQGYDAGYQKIGFSQFIYKPNYPGMSLSFRKTFFDKYKNFFYTKGNAVKTHDFFLVMFAVLNNRAYSLGTSYNNRTFTGENVAMNDNPSNTIDYSRRVQATKTYINQLNIVEKTMIEYDLHIDDLKLLRNLLLFQKERLSFLKEKKLRNFLKYILTIKNKANIRTFTGDVISLLKK